MAMFYIKKGNKFIGKGGKPITYGTPKKFDSFHGAWLWILEQKNQKDYRIVRVGEARENII